MAVNPRRGVLRHKQLADTEPKDKFEDLLVFGYACKLFRDDEKAIEIDQGKYLIPWMGEETLKIDRYDARGTLFDLKSFETPEGGYERTEGLTAEERHIEKLCDEERYFALYKDEAEEAVIKEEEIKRLNQELNEVTSEEVSYRQVPFSYNDSSENDSKKSLSNEAPVKSTLGELGDAVYVPPPVLDVPPDIVVPPTQKLARIIEKTANFISSQGTQMEIIVKTKQANNPMFQFLHFDCVLHPFYRHVLAAVRNGTYTVPPDEESSESMDKEELDRNGHTGKSDSEDDNYLHPSLQAQVVDRTPSNETTTAADTQDVQPPAEARLLIDKTASYMARNGRNLEALVLSKGDARFTFLNSGHAFHSYYIQKLTVYTELHRDIENKQAALQQSNEKTTNETVVENPSIDHVPVDQEVLKNERRKKATLFLDQIKKDKAAGKASLDEDLVESESTTSTAQKSASPSEIEIIGSVSGDPRERTRSRTRSRSPSLSHLERKRHVRRRSVSRSRSPTRSRSRSRTKHRSSSRTRRRSRSRSRTRLSRRSPSPERRRRQHKKHRSRDRHKREKKKRRSRERSRKKRRHRSRSLSSESLSRSRSRSRSSIIKSRSPSESRVSPITSAVRKLAAEASKSGSETSSPLPSQLLTVQPAFAKLAEGIRAKVIAMIDGDKK